MKKLILIVLAILLSSTAVMAAPFLVCDPYPTTVSQPTYFSIVPDGGAAITSIPEVVTGGAVRIHHDLVGVTTGLHNWTVAACNEWGCSTSVPFVFTKVVPSGPSGLRLSTN